MFDSYVYLGHRILVSIESIDLVLERENLDVSMFKRIYSLNQTRLREFMQRWINCSLALSKTPQFRCKLIKIYRKSVEELIEKQENNVLYFTSNYYVRYVSINRERNRFGSYTNRFQFF